MSLRQTLATSPVALAVLLSGCAATEPQTDRALAERDAYLHCLFAVKAAAEATNTPYTDALAFESCAELEARYAKAIYAKANGLPATKQNTADLVISKVQAAFAKHK